MHALFTWACLDMGECYLEGPLLRSAEEEKEEDGCEWAGQHQVLPGRPPIRSSASLTYLIFWFQDTKVLSVVVA